MLLFLLTDAARHHHHHHKGGSALLKKAKHEEKVEAAKLEDESWKGTGECNLEDIKTQLRIKHPKKLLDFGYASQKFQGVSSDEAHEVLDCMIDNQHVGKLWQDIEDEIKTDQREKPDPGTIAPGPGRRRGGMTSSIRLWPNGVVFYNDTSFGESVVGLANEKAFRKAVAFIEAYTCIRFQKATATDWARIHFRDSPSATCTSPIGAPDPKWRSNGRSSGRRDITLGMDCQQQGIVIHELLHSIGFHHEQSRSDRDEFVNVLLENVDISKTHNFNKYSATMGAKAPYDFASLMHYGAFSFSNNKKPVIVDKAWDGSADTERAHIVVTGTRKYMSQQDIDQVNFLYKDTCTAAVPSSPPLRAYKIHAFSMKCNVLGPQLAVTKEAECARKIYLSPDCKNNIFNFNAHDMQCHCCTNLSQGWASGSTGRGKFYIMSVVGPSQGKTLDESVAVTGLTLSPMTETIWEGPLTARPTKAPSVLWKTTYTTKNLNSECRFLNYNSYGTLKKAQAACDGANPPCTGLIKFMCAANNYYLCDSKITRTWSTAGTCILEKPGNGAVAAVKPAGIAPTGKPTPAPAPKPVTGADGWTNIPYKYCSTIRGASQYSNRADAVAACKGMSECMGLYKYKCKFNFKLCKRGFYKSSSSCVWTPPASSA